MANLTPDVFNADFDTWDKRNGRPMRYPSWSYGGLFFDVLQKLPGPTVPQFSGTVDPETTASVELVDRRTGTVLAVTTVNPADGTFGFDNVWQDPDWGADFGFRFLAPDGFCSQTFPVEDPVWNQFMGNPVINDSETGSRPGSAPVQVSNLTASIQSNGDTIIMWTCAADDETGFRVEAADYPGGPWTEIATVPENSISYTDVSPVAGSYYRVTTLKTDAFPSPPSAPVKAMYPIITGLVHWWEMDEASGNRVDSQGTLDLSPNTGMSGRNVIGGDGVEITTSTYLQGSTNGVQIALDTIFTFALWVEADNWSSASFPTILAVGRHNNSITSSEKCILYEDGGNIRFAYYSGSSYESVGVAAPSAGTPFLLCAYYDQNTGEMGISVDGAAWTTVATTIGNINAVNQTSGTITFGQWKSSFQYPFDGGVARCGYWDRVLSSAEVTALYNGGAGLNFADL